MISFGRVELRLKFGLGPARQQELLFSFLVPVQN
jgi:hypothetical protein|tara:strand:- start:321 stop:422 length:102 start_codon:yes stop_codon:yes gene_type:complete